MEVFRTVVITGSIRGAAQLLFVFQPAVSRLLSHTESCVGLSLTPAPLIGRLPKRREADQAVSSLTVNHPKPEMEGIGEGS